MTEQDPTLLAQPTQLVKAGTQLLKRLQTSDDVIYIDSGRVDLGVMGASSALEHQLGVTEGPCWLEAGAALLNLPSTVDAVAETDVLLRRVPAHEFRAILSDRPSSAHAVLLDVAKAYCQQTELTVSRMAKDAEARCAEWLLRHAQKSDKGECLVRLLQRKRLIAAQLGIAPETLSRVLRHLRERSLISGSGRVVNLVDPSGLRALAGM